MEFLRHTAGLDFVIIPEVHSLCWTWDRWTDRFGTTKLILQGNKMLLLFLEKEMYIYTLMFAKYIQPKGPILSDGVCLLSKLLNISASKEVKGTTCEYVFAGSGDK